MSKKILVIGSGIAGIAASLKLKSYGLETTIIDKGNFIGGRISTHFVDSQINSLCFFHGAQFFTARTNSFNKIIAQGISKNYIQKYLDFFPIRYRGFPTMRNFLTSISSELDIRQKETVIDISPKNENQINIVSNISKKKETFDGIISTVPGPQAVELIKKFPLLINTLSSSSYDACIALMFAFDRKPKDISVYFNFADDKGIFSWIASSNNNQCWTAHTNSDYSNKNLSTDPKVLQNEIFNELNNSFILPNNLISYKVIYSKLHFWRYAKVRNLSKGIQIDPLYPLAIAGDFMEGPRVEAAFTSGEKAAELILNRLKE